MSFFKKLPLGLFVALSFTNAVHAANDGPVLNNQDKEIFKRSRAILEQQAKMDAPDWLRMYDPDAPVKQTDDGVKKWLPAANKIGNASNDYVKNAIKNAYAVTDDAKIRTVDTSNIREDSPLVQGEELYYFISFSQPISEIKEILEVASETDARVILRGLRPEDKMVNQTALAVYKIAKDIKPLPKVSIDNRLHKVFDVTQAPSMVYRKGNNFVKVTGVATVDWFLSKSRESKVTRDLGVVSTTYNIVERDIVEEIQSRVAAVDWDEKRRKAMNRYIDNLPDFHLPTAIKDSIYKIDPRVKFEKDITTDDGTILAAKGQVINPIEHFPGQSMTLFVFDGMSEKQRALVKERMSQARGEVGLLTSRIDKDIGFKFISELSKDYGQQVYMLQERMIKRFKLRFLPAEVYLGNGQIVVREYGTQAQDEARIKQRDKKIDSESSTTTVTNLTMSSAELELNN